MIGNGIARGSGMFFFGLLMLAGLILLVVVAVRVVGGGVGVGGSDGSNRSQDPVESQAKRLLDERYARGELSTQEYQERLSVLEQRH